MSVATATHCTHARRRVGFIHTIVVCMLAHGVWGGSHAAHRSRAGASRSGGRFSLLAKDG
jgi:hypothetical protein